MHTAFKERIILILRIHDPITPPDNTSQQFCYAVASYHQMNKDKLLEKKTQFWDNSIMKDQYW